MRAVALCTPTGRHICAKTGWVSFSSKRAARLALAGPLKRKSVRVYRCPKCHDFHLTQMYKDQLGD